MSLSISLCGWVWFHLALFMKSEIRECRPRDHKKKTRHLFRSQTFALILGVLQGVMWIIWCWWPTIKTLLNRSNNNYLQKKHSSSGAKCSRTETRLGIPNKSYQPLSAEPSTTWLLSVKSVITQVPTHPACSPVCYDGAPLSILSREGPFTKLYSFKEKKRNTKNIQMHHQCSANAKIIISGKFLHKVRPRNLN